MARALLLSLLSVALTAVVPAQVLPPTPVGEEGASRQPAWTASVEDAYRKAKADEKVVIWVVMIEREVACRRMMRAVWSDPDVRKAAGA